MSDITPEARKYHLSHLRNSSHPSLMWAVSEIEQLTNERDTARREASIESAKRESYLEGKEITAQEYAKWCDWDCWDYLTKEETK